MGRFVLLKIVSALALALAIAGAPLILPGSADCQPFPLSKVPVPEPPNLSRFVKDKGAAIRLGKALFWDMQAGSDGIQACASCHFSAGADNRLTNQLNPGPASSPSTLPVFEAGPGPNYTLLGSDFPFFQVSPVDGRLGLDPLTGLPLDPNVVILRNSNDIGGSQGVSLADFLNVNGGFALDSGTPAQSPLFGASRQVTGRNAPSVINAVFNFTNFWDGRAHNIFNGENPLGPLDVNAGIWIDDGAGSSLVKQKVAIPNASLASQATGPPLSGVEMSFVGRSFPELGRKMLSLTPLARQQVHPRDSVLGPYALATLSPDGTVTGPGGLNTSYAALIRESFQDELWNSAKTVLLPGGPSEGNRSFTQMEANFPLFWGLAIQLYEATLVSDRTPFDRFLAGNTDSLSASAQNGFATFTDKCAVCHSGSELTGAAVGTDVPFCTPPDCNRLVFRNNSSHTLIRPDSDPVTFALRLVDTGFFNIGVRPSSEDAGRGAGSASGFPFPLSFARLAQLPGLPFKVPAPLAGTSVSTPLAVDGAFKTPGLRNVELTAPYFHTGSMLTLEQVVEFYTRGGNFPANPELAAAMQPIRNLRGNQKKQGELVDFLKSLTDERVRNQTAPFDHPQLMIPSGDRADTLTVLAATGGAPPPVAPGLTVNQVPPTTVSNSISFSGSVAPLSTVEVKVNALPSVFATVSGGFWSVAVSALPIGSNTVSFTALTPTGGREEMTANLTVLPVATVSGLPPGGKTTQSSATLTVGGAGVKSYRYRLDGGSFSADLAVSAAIALSSLPDGTHTVTVLGKDASGNEQPADSPTVATWTVKANPPLLTLNRPVSPTKGALQTIGGTVELGSIPSIAVQPAAQVGPVSVIPGSGSATWSCTIRGLSEGENLVTVTARDFVFNTSTVTGSIVVDTAAPALTLDPVPWTRDSSLTIAGTVESGITPQVTAVPPAQAEAVAVSGGSWSCRITGLSAGANPVSVSARDLAGNESALSASVKMIPSDGNFKGSGVADLSDALKALRIAVGVAIPSDNDLLHGDVAPLVNGLPAPDGRIDIADALIILRKVVGLISF